jgi:hypothetical protein
MFLLDVKQVNKVYQNGSTLGTSYYIGQPTQKAVDNSNYKDSNLATDKNWNYLLRSTYADSFGPSVRYINSDGDVYSHFASNCIYGVRPAFYINMSSVIFTSGNGSKSEPYILGEIKPYTINEISLLDKVNINITNNNSNTGLLCIATYKDSKLIDLVLKQINIAQGQTDTIISDISLPLGSTIKVFIWDSIDNIQPLSLSMTK